MIDVSKAPKPDGATPKPDVNSAPDSIFAEPVERSTDFAFDARTAVEKLQAKLPEAKAQHAMMFSTTGFEPNALRAARTLGMPLLAVADGKSAFARSPWGMAGDSPAWVPEYMQ